MFGLQPIPQTRYAKSLGGTTFLRLTATTQYGAPRGLILHAVTNFHPLTVHNCISGQTGGGRLPPCQHRRMASTCFGSSMFETCIREDSPRAGDPTQAAGQPAIQSVSAQLVDRNQHDQGESGRGHRSRIRVGFSSPPRRLAGNKKKSDHRGDDQAEQGDPKTSTAWVSRLDTLRSDHTARAGV